MTNTPPSTRNKKPPIFRPAFQPTKEEATAARVAAWHKRLEQQERTTATPSRGTAADRGYDKDWWRLRATIMREKPPCRCGAPAEVLDHIIPIRQRPDLRLVRTNLQPLCRQCHATKTNRHDGGFGRPSSMKPARTP